jgi:hypothetical protein
MLRLADIAYTFRFLRLLTTPWEETGAFKEGLLDAQGNVVRKPNTSEEKKVYNSFHKLVFNIKRLLNKVPFGRTRIASYAAALYLLKEHTGLSDERISKVLKKATSIDPRVEVLNEESEIFNPWILNEDTLNLKRKSYTLRHNIQYPEFTAREGTTVIALSEEAHDFIFGIPVFRVIHSKTQKQIYVTSLDLA